MTEMNGIYKVKTDVGYFYATSNGRNGRTAGV